MPRSLRSVVPLLALAVLVLGGCRDDASPAEASGRLSIRAATVDLPPNPTQASLRFVIDNATGADDRLVGVSSTVAASATVHRSVIDDRGVATMETVDELPIPARSKVTFEPGGLHVMLQDLAAPLEVDQTFDVTLTFAEHGKRVVSVRVVEPGSVPVDDAEHDDHGA